MKRSTGPLLLSFLTVAAVFAGCSDDPPAQKFAPVGGSNNAAGTPATASGTGGTPGAGSFNAAGTETGGTGGTGGDAGGTAGAAAGTAGTAGTTAGTAGTGGMTAVVAAELLVDSVVVRLRGSSYGDDVPGGGGAGAGGDGAGGAGGAGGEPGSAGGEAPVGAGGAGEGGAGEGGAGGVGGVGGAGPVGPLPEFRYAYFFDTTTEMWDLQSYGSSPNVGIDGGPEKLSRLSMMSWLGTDGEPANGSMLIKVPFSTKDEQLDIHKGFVDPHYEDWSEYEIVAKVKLTKGGDIGECLGAWIYVTTGTTYAFARGNLAAPLTVDDWVELEFDLSDPDPNSTPTGIPPAFNAAEVGQMGLHIQSQSCAP